MKKSIKVIVAVLAILIGVVTLIFYFSKQQEKDKFILVDHVVEGDIAYRTDIMKVLNEAIQYNSEIEKSLTYKLALSKIKDQIAKSGLKTEHTYLTYSFGEEEVTSIYVEISDTAKFESSFQQFTALFHLLPLADSTHIFLSENKKMSVEKRSKYLKINFGEGAELTLNDKKVKPGLKFKKLIQKENFGVINTTGTPHLDSLDYATFTFVFKKDLNLTIDWKVARNHPVQLNSNSKLESYPTQKNTVHVFTNLDTKKFISNINPFLKGAGAECFEKLPQAASALLQLWNGKASVQMGGKTARETIQFITAFDDDFNQTEKRIVKIDSIPNLGFYWGTNQPKESLDLIYELPNVKLEKEKLQIALFPTLITKLEDTSVKASSQLSDYKNSTFTQLLFIKIDIPGIVGEINSEKISNENLRITIQMKDWLGLRDREKIGISSFW